MIDALIAKLKKYYWSPLPPEQYLTLNKKEELVGLGRIAHRNYAAFNLTWSLLRGKLDNFAAHAYSVTKFIEMQDATMLIVDKEPIESWALIYNEEEFKVWWASVRDRVEDSPRVRSIDQAVHYVPKLQGI